jgi:hypothetical protein
MFVHRTEIRLVVTYSTKLSELERIPYFATVRVSLS